MRGLLHFVRQQAPEAEMDVMSRFPVSPLRRAPDYAADPLYQLLSEQQ